MQKQVEPHIAVSLVGQLKTAAPLLPACPPSGHLATFASRARENLGSPVTFGGQASGGLLEPSDGFYRNKRVRAFRNMSYVLFTNCFWCQNKRCARGFSLPAAGTGHRLPSLKACESPPYRLVVHLHAFNFVFYIEDLPPNLAAK